MCEALYELFADELVKSRNEGIQTGETNLSNLIFKLISDNRSPEIERVVTDPCYRSELMKQYQLK